MRFSNLFTAAAVLTAASALPTPDGASLQAVQVTFIGAAGAQYSLSVPLNNQPVSTNNALSISQISSSYNVKDCCTLETVDYPPALVLIAPGLWNVGPPQTVKTIKCTGSSPNPVTTINVEFDGAAGAKYSLTVPLDGSVVQTNNALSISNIITTYPAITSCKIVYVDFPATLVNTAPNTWAVGPPQTVKSIQCFP